MSATVASFIAAHLMDSIVLEVQKPRPLKEEEAGIGSSRNSIIESFGYKRLFLIQ